MNDVSLGQYAIPVVLTVLLSLFYGSFHVSSRVKPWIAVVLGVILGMVAIEYNGLPWNAVNVIDHVFYGVMTGASAVGLYEMKKTALPQK